MSKPEKITVTHPNGYTGVLYGKASLSIYRDGNIIMHTSFRNINNEQDLYKFLENIEELIEALNNKFKKRLYEKENMKV